MEPTRDEVLATRTPRELFGDAADDPRALRIRYAALARAWPGDRDAEVFEHVRRLYEAARDGPPPAAPTPSAAEPDATPAARLRAAVELRDPVASLAALSADPDAIVREDPALALTTVGGLLASVGPRLSPESLDLVELVADHPALRPTDAERLRLEALLGQLRAVWAAGADPTVPEPLVTAVRFSWGASPHRAATVWAAAALELRRTVPDLGTALARVVATHPTFFGIVRGCERALLGASAEVLVPTEALQRLRARYVPFAGVHGDVDLRWLFWALVPSLAVTVPIVAAVMARYPELRDPEGVALWIVLLGMIINVAVRLLIDRERRAAATSPDLELLLSTAERHGLFPEEVATQVASSTLHSRGIPWPADHGLIRLSRLPAGFLHVYGPAHARRVPDV